MASEVKLSHKQELFILFILKGEAGSRAYRMAGYKAANDDVAEAAASRLLSSVKVETRLNELRQAIQVRTVVTVEGLTTMLFQDREDARKEGKYAAAVSALQLIAKLHGLMIDRTEVEITHRPAPLPTKLLELSEDEWRQQFSLERPVNTGIVNVTTNLDTRHGHDMTTPGQQDDAIEDEGKAIDAKPPTG